MISEGPCGSGKTFLGCALGKETCKRGIRTRYVRLPDLLLELEEAWLAKKGISKLLRRYGNFDALVLDEWLLEDLEESEKHFILELIERRFNEGPTIFCTQYRKGDWYTRLGGGVLADAILTA